MDWKRRIYLYDKNDAVSPRKKSKRDRAVRTTFITNKMEDIDRVRLELLMMKFFNTDKIDLEQIRTLQSLLEEFVDEVIHVELKKGNLG